jgi:4'-phosphopantetheinyl transferase
LYYSDSNVLISFQSIEYLTDTTRRDQTSLERNAVHLWGIDLDKSPDCLDRCVQWLDEEERRRAIRMVREKDRHRYILAHGGLRAVLSRYVGIDPDVITVDRSEVGKPSLKKELRGRPAITFNMSHAHGRALIAVSKGQEVGVDLERIRSDVEVTKLSQRYFTPSEHAAIMQSAQEQRATSFFRYWVAKEAVLKVQGVGLRGLSQCEIILGKDGAGADVQVPTVSPIQNTLKVCFLSCGEGWTAAVAAQAVDSVVQCGLARN